MMLFWLGVSVIIRVRVGVKFRLGLNQSRKPVFKL